MKESIPIFFTSSYGNYLGSLNSPNDMENHHKLWLKQIRYFDDEKKTFNLAKQIVKLKILTQLKILKQKKDYKPLLDEIHKIQNGYKTVEFAKNRMQLNGFEGYCSKYYFQALKKILPKEMNFTERNRHPPKDGFNVLLSLGYSSLYHFTYSMIRISGLYPYSSFYHQPRGLHATLASDLMEPLRFLVDRIALRSIGLKKIQSSDFEIKENKVILDERKKKIFLQDIYSRLSQPFAILPEDPPTNLYNYLIKQTRNLIHLIDENQN